MVASVLEHRNMAESTNPLQCLITFHSLYSEYSCPFADQGCSLNSSLSSLCVLGLFPLPSNVSSLFYLVMILLPYCLLFLIDSPPSRISSLLLSIHELPCCSLSCMLYFSSLSKLSLQFASPDSNFFWEDTILFPACFVAIEQ